MKCSVTNGSALDSPSPAYGYEMIGVYAESVFANVMNIMVAVWLSPYKAQGESVCSNPPTSLRYGIP